MGEVGGEGKVGGGSGADGEGVEDVAHDAVKLRPSAAVRGGSNDDVFLAGVAEEHDLEGGEERHVEGDAMEVVNGGARR